MAVYLAIIARPFPTRRCFHLSAPVPIIVRATVVGTPATIVDGVEYIVYVSETIAATGSNSSNTRSVSVGSLPTVLGLNPSTDEISGTPTVVGTSNFTIQADDGQQIASEPFTIIVRLTLVLTTGSRRDGAGSTVYVTATYTTTGGTTLTTCAVPVRSVRPVHVPDPLDV